MPPAPRFLPANELAWEIWLLVQDQVIMLPKEQTIRGQKVTVHVPHLNFAAACPVVALAGFQGDDALWMLAKLKEIDRVMHGH